MKAGRMNPRMALGRVEPKPCPTCYAPMKPEGKGWACEKHGKPTRP